MDEWAGDADPEALDAVRAMFRSTLPLLEEILVRTRRERDGDRPG